MGTSERDCEKFRWLQDETLIKRREAQQVGPGATLEKINMESVKQPLFSLLDSEAQRSNLQNDGALFTAPAVLLC